MLELSDEDFKVAIIKILPQAIANTIERNQTIESLSKEIEDIKKNQMEILRLKNTITKILKFNEEFPCSPVVRTPCSHCRGPGFDPWSGG